MFELPRFRVIGRIRSTRLLPTDDRWDGVESTIHIDPNQFTPDAVAGIDAFSHLEILYLLHRSDREIVGARHPRGRQDWPAVGIFAQRAKDRPNKIGATICTLKAVDGLVLSVGGLDAIDGTPVLDIKPVMREFLPRGAVRQPAWADELMANYWSSTQ